MSGSPSSSIGAYNVIITATDKVDTIRSISTTISITVTSSAGGYDVNGFSTTSPYNHNNGTPYNSSGFNYQGYNSNGYNYNGYNSAMNYLASYNKNISPGG